MIREIKTIDDLKDSLDFVMNYIKPSALLQVKGYTYKLEFKSELKKLDDEDIISVKGTCIFYDGDEEEVYRVSATKGYNPNTLERGLDVSGVYTNLLDAVMIVVCSSFKKTLKGELTLDI